MPARFSGPIDMSSSVEAEWEGRAGLLGLGWVGCVEGDGGVWVVEKVASLYN